MSEIKYDFDDILIVSKPTTRITSRYKDIKLPETLPLFTAPMDTVVNLDNAMTFLHKGINVCLPRTINLVKEFKDALNFPQLFETKSVGKYDNMIFHSVGLNDIDEICGFVHPRPLLKEINNILIDVANGHMEQILYACERIRKVNPDIKIMVGNIGNPETYRWYAKSGLVDYIRVGIGNGGGCLTTKQSGVGYPMASLIAETSLVKHKMRLDGIMEDQPTKLPAIVADGGMKDYADVIKALGLGADYVMLGSIFNKALESCAKNYKNGKEIDAATAEKLFNKGVEVTKHFRGMSTKGAQKAMGKTEIKTSEGVVRYRPVEYTLQMWVENFDHYLRNAMSYANARTLDEFIGKAEFIQITKNAYDRFNK